MMQRYANVCKGIDKLLKCGIFSVERGDLFERFLYNR